MKKTQINDVFWGFIFAIFWKNKIEYIYLKHRWMPGKNLQFGQLLSINAFLLGMIISYATTRNSLKNTLFTVQYFWYCSFHYLHLCFNYKIKNLISLIPSSMQNLSNASIILTSVACAICPSVTMSSTDFSFQNLVFGIYLNFQQQKSLKNQYLSHSESKSYQINSIKSSHQDLSNNTKGTFQFLRNFRLWFNLIFSEEIIQYSRTWTHGKSKMLWNEDNAPPPPWELSKE